MSPRRYKVADTDSLIFYRTLEISPVESSEIVGKGYGFFCFFFKDMVFNPILPRPPTSY